jgi:hypothetical protein
LESAFIGLIETMFLEQAGSVKNYYTYENKVFAARYDYEYLIDGKLRKEAVSVEQVQLGALKFAEDIKTSCLRNYICHHNRDMFNNLYAVGIAPVKADIDLFGKFEFFNCGDKVYLANPDKIFSYAFSIRKLKRDLFESQWKIGFLKALLRIDIPYNKLFAMLRKWINK